MGSKLSEKWTRELIAARAREYTHAAEYWRKITGDTATVLEKEALALLAWAHVNRLLLSELREKMRVI